jgi:hypothetical protein
MLLLITHLSKCYHKLPSLLQRYKGQQTNAKCVFVMNCKAIHPA